MQRSGNSSEHSMTTAGDETDAREARRRDEWGCQAVPDRTDRGLRRLRSLRTTWDRRAEGLLKLRAECLAVVR
jgi:hypothetical protein